MPKTVGSFVSKKLKLNKVKKQVIIHQRGWIAKVLHPSSSAIRKNTKEIIIRNKKDYQHQPQQL
jgi:hypothetical protein